MQRILLFLISLSYLSLIKSECANACNGHGKCTSYDMCICHRNWQASDCSERVCQFGLAHVDSPKGDLDMSGDISDADSPVVENSFVYPYGTTEQFPAMQDSDLGIAMNSAHYYMECSNKGTCDRSSGECTCFEGFEGAACQRAACPNSCSGHGVCKSIESLAKADSNNVYKLWDRASTMGCDCDAGYGGPDCSLAQCKHGIDPLYFDDSATVKYSIYNFATLSTGTAFTDGTPAAAANTGKWAIRFYDAHGEDWLTQPIKAAATCADVITALEGLPNDVIPKGQTICSDIIVSTAVDGLSDGENFVGENETDYPTSRNDRARLIKYNGAFWDQVLYPDTDIALGNMQSAGAGKTFPSSYDKNATQNLYGYFYRIKFFGNPGKLRQPEIEIYLDGKRPTLVNLNSVIITKVWTDGQQGESNDYFADHCNGVTVTITKGGTLDAKYSKLSLTADEAKLLKACLGSADDVPSNNIDVYDWDTGSATYPHLIKLVRTTTTYTDGGYYAALYYDGTDFRLINPFQSLDYDGSSSGAGTDQYEVYTTRGTLALTNADTEAVFGLASNEIIMTRPYATVSGDIRSSSAAVQGSVSCEHFTNSAGPYCLNKTSIFTMLNTDYPALNPPYINLYTVNKIFSKPPEWSLSDVFGSGNGYATIGTHKIITDISTNWASSLRGSGSDYHPQFKIYKFTPHPSSTYNYVAECSNRGICDTTTGLCTCFPGYSSDACQEQNSLAV